MKMMDPEQTFTQREERQLLQSVAAILETSFPQPDTTQCPAWTELRDVATRRIGLADATPLVDHIGICPRCFKNYSEFRAQHKRRVKIYCTAAAIAAGVLIATATWLPLRPSVAVPNPPAPTIAKRAEVPTPATAAVLNLTRLGVARSDSPQGESRAVVGALPCTKLNLSVQLPVGSEDGHYDVALLSRSGGTLVSSSGDASLKNYVEVLAVEMDLSKLAPGNYKLGIRRVGSSWREYPIALVPKEAP
jgi:hypothetical protein